MKEKSFKKLVSMIILLVMIITISPFQEVARANEIKVQKEKDGKTIVKELVEMRTEKQKVFLNKDGTHTLKLYRDPIHYKNGDKLEDIDNNLIDNSDVKSNGKFKVKNKANKYNVMFSTDKESDAAVAFSVDKYQFELIPEGMKKKDAIVDKNTIIYPNVYENIDYKYENFSTRVKESIIINQPTDKTKFSFRLELKNLVPKKHDDGTIQLHDKDTDEVVFLIPASFAEDAGDDFLGDVKQNIRVEKNKYYLDLEVDEKWLKSPDRKYPIVVDPTVDYYSNENNSYDTFVMSAYPTIKYYTQGDLRAGKTDSTGICRSYVQFASLGTFNGMINSVQFYAYNFTSYTNGAPVQAWEVTSPWNHTTVDWNHQPSFANNFATTNVSTSGWYSWDITNLYLAWKSGRPNNGIALTMQNESTTTSYRKFYDNKSYEHSATECLTVNYTPLPLPTLKTNTVDSTYKNTSRGYIDFSWTPVQYASGYYISIYNGQYYQDFNAGSSTSWTTKGKGIFPSKTSIEQGTWQFLTNGTGEDLANDPRQLYTKAYNMNGGAGFYDYRNNTFYATCLRAVRPVTFAGSTYYYISNYTSEYAAITLPDTTKPNDVSNPVVTLTDKGKNSGAWKVNVSWNQTTDLPQNIASGIDYYNVKLYEIGSGGAEIYLKEVSVPYYQTSCAFDSMPDLKSYKARVEAFDANGNSSNAIGSSTVYAADRTAPIGPTSLSINPSTWTNANTMTLNWSGAIDSGVGISRIEYNLDNKGWVNTNSNAASGSITFDSSALPDGQHSIIVRAVDGQGNETASPSSITFNRDATKPMAAISAPASNSFISGTINITGTASDAYFKQYKLERSPAAGNEVWTQIGTTRTTAVTNGTLESFNTSLVPDGVYKIRLTVSDNNNDSVSIVTNITVDNTTEVDKAQITSPETDSLIDGTVEIWGIADETNFNSAKIEYGSGANPSSWTLLKTISTPVKTNGLLHSWNVSGMTSGVYTLKLTVTDKTNHIAEKTVRLNIQDRQIPANLGTEGHYPLGGLGIGDVHLVTGNFVMGSTDLSIPKGKGPSVSIERTYNSQNKTLGLLGWGWNLNIPKLTQNGDNSVDIINSDGSKMHFDYDGTTQSYKLAYGHYEILTKDLVSGTFALSYKGGYKTVFDNTNKKVYLKDNNGYTLTYVMAQDSITVTDAAGRTITMYIDTTYNRVYKIKDFSIEGQPSREWTYNYNKTGDLGEVIYPDNAKVTYEYNSKHDLKAIISPNENDKLSRDAKYQVKKTLINYYQDGKLQNIIHEGDGKNPNTQTEISYDEANKKAVITDGFGTADSASTTYVYDSNSRITLVTDPEGRKTKYVYGDNLNPTLPTSTTAAYGTAEAATVERTYDSRGNLKTSKDPKGYVTAYTYKNDVVETITNAKNQTTTYIYDDNLNLKNDEKNVYAYSNGLLTYQMDSSGKKTLYYYDSNGYNTKIVDADNAVLQVKVFDGFGRVKTETIQGKTTSYTYFTNNLTKTVSENVDGITQVTSYTYDKNGNRLTIKNPKDEITTYQYDIFDRLELIIHPDTKKEEYTHDSLGRIKTYKDQNGKVTTNSYFKDGSIRDVIDSDNKKVSYLYDGRGNKDKVTDLTGVLDFDYDLNNNIVKEIKTGNDGKQIYSVDRDYNELNQNIKKTVDSNNAEFHYPNGQNLEYIDNHSNGQRIDFSYDGNNFRTGIAYGNKTSVKIDPTDGGKIQNVQHKAVDGTVMFSFGYGYDSSGRIKTINDGTNTSTMYYDEKNRIENVDHGDGKTSSYTFDELGNRFTSLESGVFTQYNYFDNDKTQLKDYVKNGITTSFTYYPNGNTKTVTSPGKAIEYVYDTQNRLTDILINGVMTAKYQYDGESQRVSKTVNGKTTNYVHTEGLLAAEKDNSGNTLASYLYDEKGQPLSMTRGSETYYYHFNGHGDTIALTNNAGNVVQTYKYDIWGNLLESTGNVENPFTYGGQWGYVYDSESSLYFLKTRYYDSSIGRFTTKDRFAGFENDPDSQNRYVYCQNDPVGNVDPNGEDAKAILYGIASIVVSVLSFWIPFFGVVSALMALYALYKTIEYWNKVVKGLENQYSNLLRRISYYSPQAYSLRTQINDAKLQRAINVSIGVLSVVLCIVGGKLGFSKSDKVRMVGNILNVYGLQWGVPLTMAEIAKGF